MSKSKIVNDLYKYLESYVVVPEKEAKKLAQALTDTITAKLSTYREPALSMSSIGKPLRKIYMDLHHPTKPDGRARLKFLYGDLLEVLILWLIEQSGHKVSDCQKSVVLDGIKGSIDAIIDGDLKDIKSCSPSSYKKFEQGTLPDNDPFGYCGQLAGYNSVLKTKTPGFIAINKVTGDVCEYNPDKDFDLPNPSVLIEKAKKASKTLPTEPCQKPIPHGKSGNEVVPKCCHYCPHLHRCWKKLRTFEYSTGVEHFVKVVKEPSVKELFDTHKQS